MSESTGVIAVPKRTVDEIKQDINRIALLERQNVRYAMKIAQNKADIHDLKSGLGVA